MAILTAQEASIGRTARDPFLVEVEQIQRTCRIRQMESLSGRTDMVAVEITDAEDDVIVTALRDGLGLHDWAIAKAPERMDYSEAAYIWAARKVVN